MNMKWYLAGLIQEFHAMNKETKLIYLNWTLVNATDAEEAYSKALKFGEAYNAEYANNEGVIVTIRFRGLSDLNEIYEELEDGAEIVYDEFEEVNDEEIEHMLRPKQELSVFRPRKTR